MNASMLLLPVLLLAAGADSPHPLLAPTHAGLDAAYLAGAKGRRMGDEDRVVALFRQDLGRVRGPSSWKPSRAQFRCSLIDAYLAGYEDGTLKAQKGLGHDSDVVKDFDGDYGSQVEFVVDVRAFPAFNGIDNNIPRRADPAEVEKVEFALRTQDGRLIKPVSEPKRGPVEYAVVAGKPADWDAVELFYQPNPPDPAQLAYSFEAYQRQFRVWFPARDNEGRPIATLDQPDVTLVMTRPSGDLGAKFDLASIYEHVAGK